MQKEPDWRICIKCKKELTVVEVNVAKEKHFLPMCEKHYNYYYPKLIKCRPLMSKINLS